MKNLWYFSFFSRRPAFERLIRPDGTSANKLTYFDVPCKFGFKKCPMGMTCPLAHSKIEVVVHPARYKTRFCNPQKCFGENCCFLHEHDGEINRRDLAGRYSFSYNVNTNWTCQGAEHKLGVPLPLRLDEIAGTSCRLTMIYY